MGYDMEKARAMIYGRRSVRRYADTVDMEELKAAVAEGLGGAASLTGCVKPTVQVMDGTHAEGIFTGIVGHYGKVIAPAYLVVSACPEGEYLVQSGYVVEQIVLWLAAKGYGTCWIGIPLNTREVLARCPLPAGEKYVILLAAGRPGEGVPLLRDIKGYKRKALSEIVTGEIRPGWEDLLEAARLAPSASNGQPWRFCCGPAGIGLYCTPHGPIKKMFYEHLNRIDCGIALSHLCLAAWGAGYDAVLEKSNGTAACINKGKGRERLIPIMGIRIENKA